MNDTKFDNVLLEHIRSGQIKWVDKEENFNSLNARIETITGRSIQTAEQYQIVNYGIAGHYSPHYDAFLRSELINVRKKIKPDNSTTFYFKRFIFIYLNYGA